MVRCKLADCPVARDGRCLEGRGDACPNLIDSESSAASEQSRNVSPSKSKTAAKRAIERLYSGLPLEVAEAREFSQATRTVVTAFVGIRESGKTSLLARLHQMFQLGPIGNFGFSGSRTLPRFEELNWLATLESGVAVPLMERSSQQFDNSFLHFCVRSIGSSGVPINLLLNDISGETFGDAVANQSVCDRLLGLARCDHLVLLLDGAALTEPAMRHDHEAKGRNFLQRILQSGQIGPTTALHLVISKMDVVKGSADAAGSLAAATDLEKRLEAEFADRVASLRLWRVAARPRDGSLPTVKEIADLFSSWLNATYRYPATVIDSPKLGRDARDFLRFGIGF